MSVSSWRKIKISNMMSLDDKVRVIRAYGLMSICEKKAFKRSHKTIENIIMNEKDILWEYQLMRTKVDAEKFGCDLNENTVEVTKVALLERVISEWIQRYRRLVLPPRVVSVLREKVEVAKIILNIESFTPTQAWVDRLLIKCTEGRIRKDKNRGSLSLKEITKFILQEENISKEKAQSIYGIRALDEDDEDSSVERKDWEEKQDQHNMELDEFEAPEENLRTSEENVDATTTPNSISDNASDNDTGIIVKSEENPEVCELLENHKDFLVYEVHETENVSSESNVKVCDSIEDNKDGIEKLNTDNDATTVTIDTDQLLKDNPHALLYLKPLKEYLLSQNNVPALQLLAQIESNLVKNSSN